MRPPIGYHSGARVTVWPTVCRSRRFRPVDGPRSNPGESTHYGQHNGLAIGSALILAEDAGRLAIVTCPRRKR